MDKIKKFIDSDFLSAYVALALIIFLVLVAIFLWSISEPEAEAQAPDFIDRQGNACWREADFIWCDDGFESDDGAVLRLEDSDPE